VGYEAAPVTDEELTELVTCFRGTAVTNMFIESIERETIPVISQQLPEINFIVEKLFIPDGEQCHSRMKELNLKIEEVSAGLFPQESLQESQYSL